LPKDIVPTTQLLQNTYYVYHFSLYHASVIDCRLDDQKVGGLQALFVSKPLSALYLLTAQILII